MMDQRIVKFIRKHHVMTLATSGMSVSEVSGGSVSGVSGEQCVPYCCNLFYAYDPIRNLFVVTSSMSTVHSQQVVENRSVAGSVVLESKMVGKLQGLQFCGQMSRPQGQELKDAKTLYLKAFPFAAVMDLEIWIVELTYAKFTDNNLGFGKKLIWEKQLE